jgi:hypothetical protein
MMSDSLFPDDDRLPESPVCAVCGLPGRLVGNHCDRCRARGDQALTLPLSGSPKSCCICGDSVEEGALVVDDGHYFHDWCWARGDQALTLPLSNAQYACDVCGRVGDASEVTMRQGPFSRGVTILCREMCHHDDTH